MLLPFLALTLSFVHPSTAHRAHNHLETPDISSEPWSSKYGSQNDLGYTGLLSFAHLPYLKCLEDPSKLFDIGVLGFPFDTTTTYRPGARFGPYAIRVGSKRIAPEWWWDLGWEAGPSEFGAGILDCGDVSLGFKRVLLRLCVDLRNRHLSLRWITQRH